MKELVNWLKTIYSINKKMFVVSILIIAAFVLIGCSTSAGGSAPSSPYIGGGCG